MKRLIVLVVLLCTPLHSAVAQIPDSQGDLSECGNGECHLVETIPQGDGYIKYRYCCCHPNMELPGDLDCCHEEWHTVGPNVTYIWCGGANTCR